MRIPIPEHIKQLIIDAWMMGKTRDKIATEFNISTGSVSNIIEQWQNSVGAFDANSLRELGLALKKAEITPVQCVDGLRITNIIKQLGIDESHLYDFLQKLYIESRKQKQLPSDIARLVDVVNSYPKINSLNDIPKEIEKRRKEKIELDINIYYKKQEIKKLDQEIDNKRKEIRDLEDNYRSFRQVTQNERKEFMIFNDLKDELKKHDIDIHILEPLIDIIRIFQEMHFKPIKILNEFSSIQDYKDLVNNKERTIKEITLHIEDLKIINDNYESKIASNDAMVRSLINMENLGLNAFDIKKLEIAFSTFSNKLGLNKEEIKIRFFRYIDRLSDLISLEQDISKKTDELSILNEEISYGRNIMKSQPVVFSILQKLVNDGLDEHNILLAFNIFKKDMCNNIPSSTTTYFENLSKDIDNYKTVKDILQDLDTKISLKESYIYKLKVVKLNLANFLFSLFIIIYYYFSILLNLQIQFQKQSRIILLSDFNFLILLCIVKNPKILSRSKYKIKRTFQQTKNIKKNDKKARNKKMK
ncbi:MAG: hypothetical protein AB7F53_03205 [Nitrososphaeraceae archaeon]